MSRSTQSLSYRHRLHYSWEYRRFFNQSQVYKLPECLIFRVENDLGHFRLGITLKAKGSSVERNRVKRGIRESIRSLASFLGSYDYNVVVPGSKKLLRPYSNRLVECLKNDLPPALAEKRR